MSFRIVTPSEIAREKARRAMAELSVQAEKVDQGRMQQDDDDEPVRKRLRSHRPIDDN